MIAIQRKRVRRLSVWALIFSILLTFGIACLPIHATPALNSVNDGAEQAKDAVENTAKDTKSSVENAVKDASDGMEKEDGTVRDGNGVIGDDQAESPDRGMGKFGQVALLVLIAAVIIAIIMIVLLIPKRKKQ